MPSKKKSTLPPPSTAVTAKDLRAPPPSSPEKTLVSEATPSITPSSPKKKKTSAAPRHDEMTGTLLQPETVKKHSASELESYLQKPDYASHPFAFPCIVLLSGGLGAGKSTTIYTIMQEINAIYKPSKLGRLIYYSGSPSDRVLDMYDKEDVEMYNPKSKETFLNAMREIIKDAEDEELEEKDKKMQVIVIEDCMNDADVFPYSIKSETPLSNLMIKCRHIPVIIIMSAQKYSGLPTFARANSAHRFLCGPHGAGEISTIARDVPFCPEVFKKAMLASTKRTDIVWVQSASRKIVKGLTEPLVH
jgi:hypothetical protein